ncbi:MAG: hypothetical protein NT116_06335 [Candidatus Parcubacteria bacterium]|nr:hypothetical protein [Candidatus Parcubacteria bacterium]
MNIKKILFPFSLKNTNLKNYWWHRLFTVVFFILIIAIPAFIFLKFNNDEIKGRNNCLSFTEHLDIYNSRFEMVTEQQMKLEQNKSSYNINSYNDERDRLQKEWDDIYKEIHERINNCYAIYPIHIKLNIGLALLSFILLGYLLQIVYYKIFLYIVTGSNKSNN